MVSMDEAEPTPDSLIEKSVYIENGIVSLKLLFVSFSARYENKNVARFYFSRIQLF